MVPEKPLDKRAIYELKALSNRGVFVGQRPASGRHWAVFILFHAVLASAGATSPVRGEIL
jgi:hypothetical protein